mmetsp:Transcript_13065/g.19799  ORF Transcript_13065/g.19799 Transcript_13065/m.19799 type:complete len:180 (+) Transcript_13065:39-578(+)|eukprot:CAMPEP_0202713354 /NCGR_PEP_ID=MMETSP1385-20130828/52940_1 /ASSEMBLY_ACC=CAM_ASM_000861 /TAXON_ID=933848 /ORGANISM="Elphidium margaritaceum" /LENGTH=179 /DNA_ID=CAMNT_0049373683 /DNA_START=27 /DNA_END=566 /DNA_ORIENTATION=+
MALPVAQSVKAADKSPEVEQKADDSKVEHPDFNGKWKLVQSDNLEAFCEAAGITGMQYTLQKKSERKHMQIIELENNEYLKVQMNTQTFERELLFTIGGTTPFEYRDQHKNVISAEAIWSKDGQKIIIKAKVYAKDVNPNEEPENFKRRSEIRYLKKKKMYEEITVNGETLKRKFEKMK